MQNHRVGGGHRLEAEPAKSLTTWRGFGRRLTARGDFFRIRYLLPAIYFVAPVRALSLSSWRLISHQAYINNLPRSPARRACHLPPGV